MSGSSLSCGHQLLTWLEAQPALTAVAALERLRLLHPDQFTADHLRTVQRFMKVRRLTMAGGSAGSIAHGGVHGGRW